MKKIYTLLKNIKFLLKNDITDTLFIENLIEEKIIEYNETKPIQVLDVYQSLDYLMKNSVSFARFGDGEFTLIEGKDIEFQKASKELRNRLIEVLSSNNDKIQIGIPSVLFSSKSRLLDNPKIFWKRNGKKFRDIILSFSCQRKVYLASETTIATNVYKDIDAKEFYNCFSRLWINRDIVVICGRTIFNEITFNIFDSAKSIEYIYAPSINAFESYDSILKKSLEVEKEKLIIIILGPTAKVLAYDLTNKGYQALDLGHIAKSYDWYCKGKTTINLEDGIDFFKAD